MKTSIKLLSLLLAVAVLVAACKKEEEDEDLLPNISFKTGSGYISTDTTVAPSTTIKVGITASKAEEKDPLIRFNISRAVDGGDAATAFQDELTGNDGDSYSYDYEENVGNISGRVIDYTFTINSDGGLANQLKLKVTIQ